MSIQVHFTEEDWERIRRDWTAWWAGELDRPMVVVENWEPPPDAFLPAYYFWEDIVPAIFPLEAAADQVIDYFQTFLEAKRFYGDAFPKWWLNFGPGIVAGFLGTKVYAVPGTVWFEPSSQVNLSDLHLVYDADNVWWKRVQELTRVAGECWGSNVAVGHTDLGGNLDILASLRTTQQLLFDVLEAPEEVERLAREITHLWLRYYEELFTVVRQNGRGTTPWAGIWSPGRCYMLQCDFSYMISPKMFERFVLPDLEACCEMLDHGFYHLDGKGEIAHLDMLLSLERLRGIQWVPGDGAPPPEEWLPLLKRIRDGGKLCQLSVTPQGALTIVRELGGRGFAFHILEAMTCQDAQNFIKSLYTEGKK